MGLFDGFRAKREINARYDHLTRKKSDCGGHRELSAAEVAPIFQRVTQLSQRGFTEIRSGWWAKESPGESFQVLQFLRNMKGGDYRILWGVSLPWVPHVQGQQLRWHRTLKAARFDLWDQAYDFVVSPSTTPWQEIDVFFPDWSLGPRCFEEDLAACWNRLGRIINDWWTGVSSPTGVLQRADEQMARKWEITRHAPDPALVAEFTLAKLGQPVDALARLKTAQEYATHGDALRRAIESVAD